MVGGEPSGPEVLGHRGRAGYACGGSGVGGDGGRHDVGNGCAEQRCRNASGGRCTSDRIVPPKHSSSSACHVPASNAIHVFVIGSQDAWSPGISELNRSVQQLT